MNKLLLLNRLTGSAEGTFTPQLLTNALAFTRKAPTVMKNELGGSFDRDEKDVLAANAQALLTDSEVLI